MSNPFQKDMRSLAIKKEAGRSSEWTMAEMRMLGKKSDDEIARILKRSASSVQTKRLRLGIPTPVKWNKPWTKQELRWIGNLTDDEVASRTGRPVSAVGDKRRELAIPKLHPKCRPWVPREDALIGRFRDEEVARRVGRTASGVRNRRILLGLGHSLNAARIGLAKKRNCLAPPQTTRSQSGSAGQGWLCNSGD